MTDQPKIEPSGEAVPDGEFYGCRNCGHPFLEKGDTCCAVISCYCECDELNSRPTPDAVKASTPEHVCPNGKQIGCAECNPTVSTPERRHTCVDYGDGMCAACERDKKTTSSEAAPERSDTPEPDDHCCLRDASIWLFPDGYSVECYIHKHSRTGYTT